MNDNDQRKVTCEVCGRIWPLYEHGTPNWSQYGKSVQCVSHNPEIPLLKPNNNIIKQLLTYNRSSYKVFQKCICPQCGISFVKNHKEQITCGNSCSNRFFRMGTNNFKHKKVLNDDEVKDVEEFKKDLGDIT